ncbi:MAG: hypothetical protein QXH04_04675, partial [Candidatus Caldarchaeum sp.]
QLLSLQQQALQLYMLGAVDAGNMLTNVMTVLAGSLSDGVVSQQEFVALLNALGVDAGNVAGSLHGLLVKALEATRSAVEENRSSVEALINTLNALNGMSVVYTIVEERVSATQEVAGAAGGSGFHGAPGDFWEYQRGAWYTPEGPAYLHRGEMVLPRPVAEWFRRGGSTARTVNISITVNAAGSDPRDLAEELSRALLRRVRRV